MGWFGDPMNSGAGNRTREGKVEKGQSARDIAGFRTSSRPNHEVQREQELARAQARRERRAENNDGGLFSCATLALAMAGGVVAILASLAYGVIKVVS